MLTEYTGLILPIVEWLALRNFVLSRTDCHSLLSRE